VPTSSRTRRKGRWEAEARRHRRTWNASGLTRVAYASEAGLAPSTFSRWLRNLDRRESDDAAVSESEGPTSIGAAGRAQDVAAEPVRRGRARLLAVRVGPCGEGEYLPASPASTSGRPVEIALPSGICIRYPAGVGREELSMLVGLLEREC
jgi:hypothetical protein